MVAQGKRGQEPLAPPWVSVPTRCSPLPPNRRFSAMRGERSGERGPLVTECGVLRFVVLQTFLGTKRDFRNSAGSFPLTPALSPNPTNGSGELALGYDPPPRWGLYDEEAASCRFTNVQSPETGVAGP